MQPSSPFGDSMAWYTCPTGTLKPSVTILKWWIRASIDSPMMCLTCSWLLPWPSGPRASDAGQAIFASPTITGCPWVRSSRSRHCSTIFSDSQVSASRMRNRP